MKIFTIFKKNLNIISRNWIYFIVLFICPVLLILISGFTLNSGNFNNIQIGVIDEDPDYDFNLDNLKNVKTFSSLSDCLYDLSDSKTTVCMFVKNIEGIHRIDIYLDNTVKMVEYYSKQFIMENILQEQSFKFEQTSDEINSQLTIYSTSIGEAKVELNEVFEELDSQEKVLIEYKKNLSELRTNFDEIYYSFKELEPVVNQLKIEINENNQNLEGNITEFRNRKQEIETSILILRNFLYISLDQEGYNYANLILLSISDELNSMDDLINELEKTQELTNDLVPFLENYDEMMNNLEEIRITLDQLDGDLDSSIQKTRESKERISSFILRLNTFASSVQDLSGSLESGLVSASFKNAFPITDKRVFLVFPTLVAIIITFTSLVLSNMFILKQINQPSYFRELIAPTRDTSFLMADYLINLFFVGIQAFVLFLVGYFWFNLTIDNLKIFILGIFLTASIFVFIGMSIGYLVRNQSISILLTIFLLILLLILADILAPSVVAGPFVKFIINLNPLVILSKILTDSMVLNKELYRIVPSFFILGVFLIISVIIAYISKKICKKNLVQ